MKPDKKYAMKRKRYGWGWTPSTWQGWLFILLQIGIVLVAALQLPTKPNVPSFQQITTFFVLLGFVISSLILVGSFAAPKPRWRWGKKDSDNPDEDF